MQKWKALGLGSTGEMVSKIQTAIGATADGTWGPGTQKKWEAFVANNYGYSVVGVRSYAQYLRVTGTFNSGPQPVNTRNTDKLALDKLAKKIGPRALVAACYTKACAPPPAGKGGSLPAPSGSSRVGRAKAAAEPKHKVITPDMARGDSRPVSPEEFQRLGDIGRKQLAKLAANSAPPKGLDENWSTIKAQTYDEVLKPWGGATINARTGETLPQGVNKYAITVKDPGLEPVTVRENPTPAEFEAAMDTARQRFGSILERQDHHLGVFHDDDSGRIDIDPVLVVSRSRDVETIGVASHAIGGAYNFRDGLGYWPPHVDTSPTATRKRDDYVRTYET